MSREFFYNYELRVTNYELRVASDDYIIAVCKTRELATRNVKRATQQYCTYQKNRVILCSIITRSKFAESTRASLRF